MRKIGFNSGVCNITKNKPWRQRIFYPKSNKYDWIWIKEIIKKWETTNFGWAVVKTINDENKIVCLG